MSSQSQACTLQYQHMLNLVQVYNCTCTNPLHNTNTNVNTHTHIIPHNHQHSTIIKAKTYAFYKSIASHKELKQLAHTTQRNSSQHSRHQIYETTKLFARTELGQLGGGLLTAHNIHKPIHSH